MRQRILFVVLLAISTLPLLSHQTTEQQSPVKPTPESLSRAKKLYGYDCAVCHGLTGDGRGDMAGDFPGKIKDFTNPDTLKDFTDEQLFIIIRDGKGDMPPEGKRAKTEELWGLVSYVRSFAKKNQ